MTIHDGQFGPLCENCKVCTEADMKSRFTLIAGGLLIGFLIGIWFGQKSPSNHRQSTVRTTVTPFNSDGWQLSAGHQTGPAAVLSSTTNSEPATALQESRPGDEEQHETPAPSGEPEIQAASKSLANAGENRAAANVIMMRFFGTCISQFGIFRQRKRRRLSGAAFARR